jgi:hypothetical protein
MRYDRSSPETPHPAGRSVAEAHSRCVSCHHRCGDDRSAGNGSAAPRGPEQRHYGSRRGPPEWHPPTRVECRGDPRPRRRAMSEQRLRPGPSDDSDAVADLYHRGDPVHCCRPCRGRRRQGFDDSPRCPCGGFGCRPEGPLPDRDAGLGTRAGPGQRFWPATDSINRGQRRDQISRRGRPSGAAQAGPYPDANFQCLPVRRRHTACDRGRMVAGIRCCCRGGLARIPLFGGGLAAYDAPA